MRMSCTSCWPDPVTVYHENPATPLFFLLTCLWTRVVRRQVVTEPLRVPEECFEDFAVPCETLRDEHQVCQTISRR